MITCAVIAGLFALISGLSTWRVVQLQRIEIEKSAAQLERYKADASERVAAAMKEASKANERTAALGKETEELKAANLELEAALAPRRISEPQRQLLIGSMKARGKHKILVSCYSLDAEGTLLGQSIIKILQDAGFTVFGLSSIVPITTLKTGIHVTAVTNTSRPLAHRIAEALGKHTRLTVTYNPEIPTDEAQIEFGGSGDVKQFDVIVLVAIKPLKDWAQ